MSSTEFLYEIGQKVSVIPIGLPGTVLQRCDRGGGCHDYQVCWWADAKRNVDWLLPHELAPL